MNMMTAYYIDTIAKEHWQTMRSDQQPDQADQPRARSTVPARLKGLVQALTAVLHWNRQPLSR